MRSFVMMAAALGGSIVWPQGALADQFQRDVIQVEPHAGTSITAVTVDNRLGNVQVIGHDRPELVLKSEKRAKDDQSLERLKVSFVPDPAGPITVRTSISLGDEGRPIVAGSARVDLVLLVPRGAKVQVTAWNGQIEVAGVDNGAALTTNEGDINVRNTSGAVTTFAAQGKQRFEQVFGALAAEGLTGDLQLSAVTGKRLEARLQDGPITADRVRSQNVRLRTTNGDIQFEGELLAGGSYQFAAYRGDVTVTFRRGVSFRVEAYARMGEVALPSELVYRPTIAGRRIATYGGGRDLAGVIITSRHGDVRVGLVGATSAP